MSNTSDHVPDQSQHLKASLQAIDPAARANVVTLRLQTKGVHTAAQVTDRPPPAVEETHGAGPFQGQLVTISSLCGQPLQRQEGTPLTVADQRWFAELTTSWVRAGCPADLHIPFSLPDAAQILGRSGEAGTQVEAVRASLVRLRAATFESALRHSDRSEETTIWGLLERAQANQPGAGPGCGWAEITRQVAELLQEGRAAYLHAPTWDRLRERDELAARLWAFFETEEMPSLGRRYRVFSALPGEAPRPGGGPAVADLIGPGKCMASGQTTDRIRRASRVLEEVDPRYVAEVVRGSKPSLSRLEVRRRAV
jgi:hypothetical protein